MRPMNTFVIVLIVLFALAAAGALIMGIVTMASGKDVTGRKSNKLMFTRVYLQAGAVALVVLLAFMVGAL